MDPVNGDAELAVEGNVDHAEDTTSPTSGEEEHIARSPSYWEEVDQEEIERERRYAEYTGFNNPATRTSRFH